MGPFRKRGGAAGAAVSGDAGPILIVLAEGFDTLQCQFLAQSSHGCPEPVAVAGPWSCRISPSPSVPAGQALLAYALRAYGRNALMPSGWLALAADARLGPSVQGMLQAPAKPWAVESLGEAAAMSRATYARHFCDRAGMSVGAFVTQIRMMHACALLQDTQRGQAEIGPAVGYRSEAAFGKAFRAVLGTTPGRWRRAQRGS